MTTTGELLAAAIGAAAAVAIGAPVAYAAFRRQLARATAAERRANAAERMAEIGAMTAGLTHEIKNPLSTIGLNAQLLAEGVREIQADEEHKNRLVRRIDALHREAERLRDILADFLEFAGELRLDRAPADLNLVVDELADFYLPQAEHHRVRLRTQTAPQPLHVIIDTPLIKQALLNLLINATQAMAAQDAPAQPAQRELMLRAEQRSDRDGPKCVVHVTDTGPGIHPDHAQKIFTPYFTTKAGGSGLGLPTTKRLIEAHGGKLELHSEPGTGTDFAVVLPRER